MLEFLKNSEISFDLVLYQILFLYNLNINVSNFLQNDPNNHNRVDL